jgi:hypothetical protein
MCRDTQFARGGSWIFTLDFSYTMLSLTQKVRIESQFAMVQGALIKNINP